MFQTSNLVASPTKDKGTARFRFRPPSRGRAALSSVAVAIAMLGTVSASRTETPRIAAGDGHTCVLTSAGGVRCWGNNSDGELGDGTNEDRPTPVNVVGLASDVVAVAAGTGHSCALTSAGGVKCWGANDFGQLGDGTTFSRSTPVDVGGLTSGVSTIAVGDFHSCAALSTGGVKCWGDNGAGQLGDGTGIGSRTPVDVVSLPSQVVSLAAGYKHTCSVTIAGAVKCWGSNDDWQLGAESSVPGSLTPVDVVGLTSGAIAVTAGYAHSCAATSAGGIKCWGDNEVGQLGDGTETGQPTPVDVVGLTGPVSAVAAGQSHTCALTSVGGVQCWGYVSQVGNGTESSTTDPYLTPVDVLGPPAHIVAIAAGLSHTCALASTGSVTCWGENSVGQLGDGTTTARLTPTEVPPPLANGVMVAAGPDHTCALTAAGGVKCWGSNQSGALGDGTTTASLVAQDPVGMRSGARWVTVGGTGGLDDFSCAVTTEGLPSVGEVTPTDSSATARRPTV